MRVAIFGGAFDPPHIGHTMAVYWLLATGQVDKVWVLPSYKHPLDKEPVTFEHRIAMCKKAFEVFEGVVVKEDEKAVGGQGYTIELLDYLERKYPKDEYEFVLVIGGDNWINRDTWESWDKIKERIEVIVIGREGVNPLGTIGVCDVCSTDIRKSFENNEELVGKKKVPRYFTLPIPVLEYIEESDLYVSGNKKSGTKST